ncbi:MAG: carbohydrate porin [Planctomycetota bacterium]
MPLRCAIQARLAWIAGIVLHGLPAQAEPEPSWLNPVPGLTFGATYTGDWSSVLHGGVRHRSTYRGLAGIDVGLDLDRAFGFGGGEFYAHAEKLVGRNASRDVGDIQSFSNIDGDEVEQLDELWYQHRLGDLRVKVGKVDSNSEFAFLDAAKPFLNQSAAFSPTIFGLPAYPNPATSINVLYEPDCGIYAGAGLYDGAGVKGVRTGARGPSTFFDGGGDYFWIAEAGYRRDGDKLGLGLWHQTATVERIDGGSDNGTEGLYVLGERLLWREASRTEGDSQGLRGFALYGFADRDVVQFGQHFLVGLTYTGLAPGRDLDVLGAMVSRVELAAMPGSAANRSAETAYELFYRAQICASTSLTADLQFIDDPSGDRTLGDALVVTLRIAITL